MAEEDKAHRNEEGFSSLVAAVLWQLKTRGTVDQAVLKTARSEARKVPYKERYDVADRILDDIRRGGSCDEETGYKAFLVLFGKPESERRIRIPLMVAKEIRLQRERRNVVDAVLLEFAATLTLDEIHHEEEKLFDDRRFYLQRVGDTKNFLSEIKKIISEIDVLRPVVEGHLLIISVFDQEIREVKKQVNERHDFSVDELRDMARLVRKRQAMKAQVWESVVWQGLRLSQAFMHLHELESWLKSAEVCLALELSHKFDGLNQVNGDLARLYQSRQASDSPLDTSIEDELAKFFRDDASETSKALALAAIKRWRSPERTVETEALINLSRQFRDEAEIARKPWKAEAALRMAAVVEGRLERSMMP